MNEQNLIPVDRLCDMYSVEATFFLELNEVGLIDITSIKKTLYLHQDYLPDFEKIIRIHRELHINLEGIDVILSLLRKEESLYERILQLENRLRLYE